MRWVISPVIGSGTGLDPYRAKVADYGSHVAIIPGNSDGTPQSTWALTLVADDALTGVEGDGECVMLPDLGPAEVITPDLIPIGRGTVDMPNLNEWVYLTMTEAVEGVGQQLDPTFTYGAMSLG